MRYFVVCLGFLLLFTALSAFSREDLERMRNDSAWIVGKGKANSDSAADRAAIMDLLSQISVQVSASSDHNIKEIDGSVKEHWESALKTYSNARLDGAERRIFESSGSYEVYRYMRREDYKKLFNERQNMLKDYVNRGIEAEKSLRIGDALMNYYWALLLLRTHPDVNRITHNIENREHKLITYLPEKLRVMFSDISFEANKPYFNAQDRLTRYEVEAKYQRQSVRNLDVKYYMGNDWSMPITFSDGKALLEFYCEPNKVPSPISINIVYEYQHKAGINQELLRVFTEMDQAPFPESRVVVKTVTATATTDFKPKISIAKVDSPVSDNPKYQQKASEIVALIHKKDFNALEKLCTPQAKEHVNKILRYGNARPGSQNFQISISKSGEHTIVRGVPIQFSFPRSGRSFGESLSIYFDSMGMVDMILLGLSPIAIKDIMGSIKANDAEKEHIISFVEGYKTAYCLKDIDYVQRVFSENALIIVGSKLKDDPTPMDSFYSKMGQNWRVSRYTKSQYVENLKQVFAGNDYVNLGLEDNIITRTNDKDSSIYGIQIRQNYYSQNYADEGYLFLMFDLKDLKSPKIYVRTWQPEKNPDGSIYGLKDFFINP